MRYWLVHMFKHIKRYWFIYLILGIIYATMLMLGSIDSSFAACTQWAGNTFTCLSSDTKPTAQDGSRLVETDTRLWWIRKSSAWTTMATPAGGGSWATVDDLATGDARWTTIGHSHGPAGGWGTVDDLATGDNRWTTTGHVHSYEPVISSGGAGQYWTGSKSWQSFSVTLFPLGDGRWSTLGHLHTLNSISNPTADVAWSLGDKKIDITANPFTSDYMFRLHATGDLAASGDMLHVHHESGTPSAGSDLIHVESISDVPVGIRIDVPVTANAIVAKGSFWTTGNVDIKGVLSALTYTVGASSWSTLGHGHTYEPVIASGGAGQYWNGSKAWESFTVTMFPAGDARWTTLGHGHSGYATETWTTSITNTKEPSISAGGAGQYWTGSKAWESFSVTLFPQGDGRWTTLGHRHDGSWATVGHGHAGAAGQIPVANVSTWNSFDVLAQTYGDTKWTTMGHGHTGMWTSNKATGLTSATNEHCANCHATRVIRANYTPNNTSWNTTVVQNASWNTMATTITNLGNMMIRLTYNGATWTTVSTTSTLTYTVTWSSIGAVPTGATTRITLTNVPATARVLHGTNMTCEFRASGTGSQTVTALCFQNNQIGTSHQIGWATFTWDLSVPIGIGINTAWNTVNNYISNYGASVEVLRE